MRSWTPQASFWALKNWDSSLNSRKIISSAINKPYGMVWSTGRPGSGQKPFTLYYCAGHPETAKGNPISPRSRIRSRDPRMKGNQSRSKRTSKQRVDLRRSACASFLRQGTPTSSSGRGIPVTLENRRNRDQGRSAGHLVLSTLHTNDAPQSIARLANMGVPTYNIVSTVHMVLAQRLW